jgi:hypothetical protein
MPGVKELTGSVIVIVSPGNLSFPTVSRSDDVLAIAEKIEV